MAIKTKRISDLGLLTVDDAVLNSSDVYFLGCQSGVTGKISSKELINSIKTIVGSANVGGGGGSGSDPSGDMETHMKNGNIHVTVEEKNKWNNLVKGA